MRSAILRHDIAIAIAALRRLRRRTGDLLTVIVILPLLALIMRAWLDGLSESHRELVALSVSWLFATVLTKALLERVWFHQSDGILARFAQRSDVWFYYVLPMMLAALFAAILCMTAFGILHPRGTMAGTFSGIATGFAAPFVQEGLRRLWRGFVGRMKRALPLSRPSPRSVLIIAAAISAVAGIVCATLPQENYLDAGIACTYGLGVILLTGRVNAATVRYMTLIGHASIALLRKWLPIQLALMLPLVAVLLIAQSWVAAGVAALILLGLPAITALRIFAYRAFSRLVAEWMVAGVVFAASYAAFALPPLGPVIITAAIVWFARLGSTNRWLLE